MSEKPKRYYLCLHLRQAAVHDAVDAGLRAKGITWERLDFAGGGRAYRMVEEEYNKLDAIAGTKPVMKGFKVGEEVLPFLLNHPWHIWIISGGVTEEDGLWVTES